MSLPRLRQLVIAAHSAGTADTLARLLGLGDPFIDPGVGAFGIANRVFAIGDQFLEVVFPVQAESALMRFLRRSGEGGYMVIFQTDRLAEVRARTLRLGMRHVWSADLAEISATHLHPSDTGGAIVSVDMPRPAASWLWGGPDWAQRSVPGMLAGLDLESSDAPALAQRWASIFGLSAQQEGIRLQDADIRVCACAQERLSRFRLKMPDPDAIMSRAAQLGLDHCANRVSLAGVGLVIEPL